MSHDRLVELRNVAVPRRLLPLTADIVAGRLIHLVGPNGAGKSTLLAAVAGLQAAEGDILFKGRLLGQWRGEALAAHRAYLAQQALPPGIMPVFQYMALHQPTGVDGAAIDRAMNYLTDALSLSDKLHRPLNRLSGGEWQRVRLAASLLQVWPAINPQAVMLLLDEPAASLDIAQRVALDALLAEVIAAGLAVMVCGHDLNHTLRHADDVWLLSAGRLAAAGSARRVMQPALLSAVFGVDFAWTSAGDTPWLTASGTMTMAANAV
ncbi:vitamin B12 ABC transporter ATP-binding protein BtuD [Martelella alba]|uniref:Vitamin B12 ABC transporter ATP-binding protein BtuD n=1 Tax=Martelella alba TaxID=2590451 RepID=A0ABY2SKK3_9HYPH|nr:vitamin B12 ABC transporter ATP-binding protein BtuD [Martelella alba]TKI05622.1 vitamin B12 ABC transporter ATP-binding protein BtuD [Martelella alba]